MTATANGVSVNGSFPSLNRVPIADLEHDHGHASDSYIEASVSLVWPYSSSTRRFSLLLSETNARRLKTRQQVKVTFHDGAAKAAQASRIGIGDEVKLSLEGCVWQQEQEEISTPGKRLDYDLEFRKTLTLEVNPTALDAKLVHYTWNGTPSPEPTPTIQSIVETIKPVDVTPSKISVRFDSPTSRHPFRLSSGSFIEASLDPFAEDKEYVYGRSRKRTKFARDSGAWRLLDGEEDAPEAEVSSPIPAPPAAAQTVLQQSHIPSATIDLNSPVDDTFEQQLETTQPSATIQTEQRLDDHVVMPPPQTPARPLRRGDRHIIMPEQGVDDTTTPRLHPLASPGLPLVSPLVSRFGAGTGYFSAASTSVSELDASSTSTRDRNGSVISSSSDDSLVIVEPTAQQGQSLQDLHSSDTVVTLDHTEGKDAIEDDDMYGAPEMISAQPKHVFVSKDAPSALDVLEEFLQMSPTEPTAAKPSPDPVSPAQHDPPTIQPEKSSRGTSRSGSAVPSVDGARDGELPLQLPKHFQSEQEGTGSSPLEQPLHDTESIGSESASESTSSSRDGPEYPADGQEEVSTGSHQVQADPVMKEIVISDDSDRDQSPQATPSSDSTSQHLRTQGGPLLLTPARTQEQDMDMIAIQNGKFHRLGDNSHLPTPDQTQVEIDPTQTQHSTSLPEDIDEVAEELIEESLELRGRPAETMESTTLRRVSQRQTQKSFQSEKLSSPYFTPRRQLPPAMPSSAETDHILPASSPPGPRTSSPPRRTRKRTPARDEAMSILAHSIKSNDIPAEDVSVKALRSKTSKPPRISTTGLGTPVAYYPCLLSLHEYFNQLVDVIAICSENSMPSKKAEKGPKDWFTTLRIVDPSSDPGAESRQAVQIFRPKKIALPLTKRGDAIVLRDFKVQTQKHKSVLLSSDSSAWVVFDGSLDEQSMIDVPLVTGPPLEYGDDETAYISETVKWWNREGADQFPSRPKTFDDQTQKVIQGLAVESHPSADIEVADEDIENVNPRRERDGQQDPFVETQSSSGQEFASTGNEELPKSPRRSRRQQELAIETGLETVPEPPIASVEEPPKSPIRTRRKQKLAEEAKEDEDEAVANSTNNQKHQAPSMTPSRRQPSRRAKTPSANPNGAPLQQESSPQQALSISSRRTRATKSPSTMHELRDGTQYADGSLDAPLQELSHQPLPKPTRRSRATKSPSVVHELRDGTKYVDDADAATGHEMSPPQQRSPKTTRRTRATKSPSTVHELRDGTKYMDDETLISPKQSSPPQTRNTPSVQTRRTRATKSPSTVHELRDGTKYIDDGNEKKKDKEAVHELRNGRRYADEE